ncbi:hypothetical protein [Candidatus Nitrosocosmicus arcticus]|uniref:Uncharacterized protein n=1 Tax=Candidatus Nitrosocosmicus arcticus TaxID=2035267 RepID=A0A557SV14_9ARCH|nr:hypothetical protein [Candidatus Nitrosocosmicus arcticus]TVP40449.1 hypothetical protein NARC_70026 [Candidatus Nitrosocosmicus arcticus]
MSYSSSPNVRNVINERKMKEALINYIKKNPQCNKNTVIHHCVEEKGIGSRRPLLNMIKRLIDGRILKCEKRGKSHLLTVVSENLLVSIPSDLEAVFAKFVGFLNAVKEVEKERTYLNQKYLYRGKKAMQDIAIVDRVLLLPYEVLEVITEIYMKFYESVIKFKLDNPNQISQLYGHYCEYKDKMQLFLSDNFSPTKDLINLLENRKIESPLGKLCNIVDICKFLGIEKYFYDFLYLLMTRNIEACLLLYGLENKKAKNNHLARRDKKIRHNIDIIIDQIRSKVDYFLNEQ